MLAGHRADAATWFNPAAGGFVTSSAYTSAPVPFVAAFTKANPVDARTSAKVWTRMLPAERYLFDDAGRGEKPPAFWTAEFPHALEGEGRGARRAVLRGLGGEPVLGRVPRAPRDRVGRRAETGAGHRDRFPRRSVSRPSTWSATTSGRPATRCRTCWPASTARSARCSTTSTGRVGAGNYVVALTADHGVAPIPEQAAALGIDAGRLDGALVPPGGADGPRSGAGAGTYTVRSQGLGPDPRTATPSSGCGATRAPSTGAARAQGRSRRGGRVLRRAAGRACGGGRP